MTARGQQAVKIIVTSGSYNFNEVLWTIFFYGNYLCIKCLFTSQMQLWYYTSEFFVIIDYKISPQLQGFEKLETLLPLAVRQMDNTLTSCRTLRHFVLWTLRIYLWDTSYRNQTGHFVPWAEVIISCRVASYPQPSHSVPSLKIH